jgi:hypothetical protein
MRILTVLTTLKYASKMLATKKEKERIRTISHLIELALEEISVKEEPLKSQMMFI